MEKETMLEEIYNEAFNDELEKVAGAVSEIAGQATTGMIGSPIGAIVAAMTPGKTDKEMKSQQKKTWSNFLPGVGSYRYWKRLGHSQRKFNKELEKKSSLVSEVTGPMASSVLPAKLKAIAGLAQAAGTVGAAFTPTKTKKEMIEQQKKTWSNLIPGVGNYRLMKRVGYSQKSLNKAIKKD